MLRLNLPPLDYFDEDTEKFITIEGKTLLLEHSLVSLSKWESIHEKPFLTKQEKTTEEIYSYIWCMIFSPADVSPDIVSQFSSEDLSLVSSYMDRKMTATWFNDQPGPSSSEVVTSELIYYWLVSLNIPFTCETWNLNRLLTLIRICSIKNNPKKKQSRAELLRRNRELNAQRRAQFGTTG